MSSAGYTRSNKRTFWWVLLVGVALLGVVAIVAKLLIPHQGPDRLAGVTSASVPFQSEPTYLLTAEDQQTINRIVNEGRLFGLVMAVRIERVSTPQKQTDTQAAADALYKESPIESTVGDADGLLLFVQMPADDASLSTAAFSSGENFLPRGGVSQPRLDRTLNGVILPLITSQSVAQAVINAVAWVVYDQVFITVPEVSQTEGQQHLGRLSDSVLAAIAAIAAISYLGFAWWTRRQTQLSGQSAPHAPVGSPYTAGALGRGKVDESTTTAALISLMDAGSLIFPGNGREGLKVGTNPVKAEPLEQALWETTVDIVHANANTIVSQSLERLNEAFSSARDSLEDDLIANGYFSPEFRRLNQRLWIAGAGLVALAVYLIVPSLIGRGGIGFLASCALIVVVATVVWWSLHRSRRTNAGQSALNDWIARISSGVRDGDYRSVLDAEKYRLIVEQEALVRNGERLTQRYGAGTTDVIASLRGMSAG